MNQSEALSYIMSLICDKDVLLTFSNVLKFITDHNVRKVIIQRKTCEVLFGFTQIDENHGNVLMVGFGRGCPYVRFDGINKHNGYWLLEKQNWDKFRNFIVGFTSPGGVIQSIIKIIIKG